MTGYNRWQVWAQDSVKAGLGSNIDVCLYICPVQDEVKMNFFAFTISFQFPNCFVLNQYLNKLGLQMLSQSHTFTCIHTHSHALTLSHKQSQPFTCIHTLFHLLIRIHAHLHAVTCIYRQSHAFTYIHMHLRTFIHIHPYPLTSLELTCI